MATYDADAYLKAIEKPTVKIGEKIYEGRLLSVHDCMKLDEQMQKLDEGTAQEQRKKSYEWCREYLYRLFPKPSLPWRTDVAKEVLESPTYIDATMSLFMVTLSAFSGNPNGSVTSGTK